MRFIHQIAVDNQLHHTRPRELLKKSWWHSSWDIVLACVVLIASTWWFNALSWEVVLFSVLITNANQIHKWSHQNHSEKHAVVKWLQAAQILQGPRQHSKHHSGDKNTHYCVMTNVLNPLLEKVHFWRGLENLLRKIYAALLALNLNQRGSAYNGLHIERPAESVKLT